VLISAACSISSLAGPVTFGQGVEQSTSQDFQLVDTGSGVTLTASSQIFFVLSNISGTLPAGLSGPVSATFTLDLSSSTFDTLSNGNISESGFTGTFSIVLNTPVDGRTNLLSGSIGAGANLTLAGKNGGTSAGLSGSTPPDSSVTYTSAFTQFPDMTNDAFSLALSSVVPSFEDNGSGYLAPFEAAGIGTFSADSPTSIVPTPEPISALLAGFGLGSLWAVRRAAEARAKT